MRHEQRKEGKFVDHGHGLGTVTPEMVHQRAREIAYINGRSQDHLIESDWEQARNELLGLSTQRTAEEDDAPGGQTAVWDPVPGSTGREVPAQNIGDEQTFAEELVNQGLEEAEHEQMVEGTRESLRKDFGRKK